MPDRIRKSSAAFADAALAARPNRGVEVLEEPNSARVCRIAAAHWRALWANDSRSDSNSRLLTDVLHDSGSGRID